MPEVDAVGDHAEPHQRREGQHARDQPALLQRHRGDDEDRRDRHHDQQAAAELRRTARREVRDDAEHRQPDDRKYLRDQRPQRDRICVP